jgi:hypothetical protein
MADFNPYVSPKIVNSLIQIKDLRSGGDLIGCVQSVKGDGKMKRVHTIIAGLGFGFATAIGGHVNHAEADGGTASNSQLRGQYAGTESGGVWRRRAGSNSNLTPIDSTTSYSTTVSADVVFTFDGYGNGTANFTNIDIRVPGPNAFGPQATLSNGLNNNFTYSVGPKNTVTVTFNDLTFNLVGGPSTGFTATINQVVLDGQFGPNGVTVV